jgi:hypothetical protein
LYICKAELVEKVDVMPALLNLLFDPRYISVAGQKLQEGERM